jgi:hypothetical protein
VPAGGLANNARSARRQTKILLWLDNFWHARSRSVPSPLHLRKCQAARKAR